MKPPLGLHKAPEQMSGSGWVNPDQKNIRLQNPSREASLEPEAPIETADTQKGKHADTMQTGANEFSG